jgi:hypothetical protein
VALKRSSHVLLFAKQCSAIDHPFLQIFSPNEGEAFLEYPPVEAYVPRFSFKLFKLVNSQNVATQLVEAGEF